MARVFPNALRTFTIQRKVAIKGPDGNTLPNPKPLTITTGQSISIAAKMQMIDASDSGQIYQSTYVGATFTDANIFINDVLMDESEKEADGKPCRYTVTGKTYGPFSMHLQLERTKPGS